MAGWLPGQYTTSQVACPAVYLLVWPAEQLAVVSWPSQPWPRRPATPWHVPAQHPALSLSLAQRGEPGRGQGEGKVWVAHPPSLSPSRCLSLRTRRGPSPSHRAAIKGCQHRQLISASGECCEVTAAGLAEGTGSGMCLPRGTWGGSSRDLGCWNQLCCRGGAPWVRHGGGAQ